MASLARPARVGFVLVAWLFVVCVAIQTYLAGLGVFSTTSAFIAHREFGYLFGILTLVMVVLAVAGRLSMLFIGGSILLLVLFALQSVFVLLRSEMPDMAALHPLNGFVIFFMAVFLAWRSTAERRRQRATG